MREPTEAEWLEGNDPMTERERMEGTMTDNRANEPTPEQVVFDALAELERGMGVQQVCDALRKAGLLREPGWPTDEQVEAAAKELAVYEWMSWEVVPDHIKVRYRAQARAALEAAARAAQGAAPQAPKDIHEPNHDRVYCVRCGGNWPCQPPPVLPSSTVDEDKLAEVIADAVQHTVSDYVVSEAIPVARAVIASRAEWLKR